MPRPRLSRDELIERGEEFEQHGIDTHLPWIYQYKVKTGTRKTRNVEKMYYNIPHLMADAIVRWARNDETLNIYAIRRIMRAQLRSYREDV